MNVARPNLDRGFSAGVKQQSFGNFRDSNMSFPAGITGAQPPPTSINRPRRTYDYPMFPIDNNYDMNWSQGTLLFIKKDNNFLKHIYDLHMARMFMYQSGINEIVARKKQPANGGTTTYAAGSMNGTDDAQQRMKKKKTYDHSFLGTVESIREHFDFIGPAFGETDPGTQVGSIDITDSVTYTGNSKHVPVAIYGEAMMPMVFDEDLFPGQTLYMYIKGVKPQRDYATPSQVALKVPEIVDDFDIVPDILFYSRQTNLPPPRTTDLTELYKCEGGQPPLTDRCYIEWNFDERFSASRQKKPVMGKLKEGPLWQIGRNYNRESAFNSNGVSRLNTKQKEPLPFSINFNALPKMEIQVDIERILAHS